MINRLRKLIAVALLLSSPAWVVAAEGDEEDIRWFNTKELLVHFTCIETLEALDPEGAYKANPEFKDGTMTLAFGEKPNTTYLCGEIVVEDAETANQAVDMMALLQPVVAELLGNTRIDKIAATPFLQARDAEFAITRKLRVKANQVTGPFQPVVVRNEDRALVYANQFRNLTGTANSIAAAAGGVAATGAARGGVAAGAAGATTLEQQQGASFAAGAGVGAATGSATTAGAAGAVGAGATTTAETTSGGITTPGGGSGDESGEEQGGGSPTECPTGQVLIGGVCQTPDPQACEGKTGVELQECNCVEIQGKTWNAATQTCGDTDPGSNPQDPGDPNTGDPSSGVPGSFDPSTGSEFSGADGGSTTDPSGSGSVVDPSIPGLDIPVDDGASDGESAAGSAAAEDDGRTAGSADASEEEQSGGSSSGTGSSGLIDPTGDAGAASSGSNGSSGTVGVSSAPGTTVTPAGTVLCDAGFVKDFATGQCIQCTSNSTNPACSVFTPSTGLPSVSSGTSPSGGSGSTPDECIANPSAPGCQTGAISDATADVLNSLNIQAAQAVQQEILGLIPPSPVYTYRNKSYDVSSYAGDDPIPLSSTATTRWGQLSPEAQQAAGGDGSSVPSYAEQLSVTETSCIIGLVAPPAGGGSQAATYANVDPRAELDCNAYDKMWELAINDAIDHVQAKVKQQNDLANVRDSTSANAYYTEIYEAGDTLPDNPYYTGMTSAEKELLGYNYARSSVYSAAAGNDKYSVQSKQQFFNNLNTEISNYIDNIAECNKKILDLETKMAVCQVAGIDEDKNCNVGTVTACKISRMDAINRLVQTEIQLDKCNQAATVTNTSLVCPALVTEMSCSDTAMNAGENQSSYVDCTAVSTD